MPIHEDAEAIAMLTAERNHLMAERYKWKADAVQYAAEAAALHHAISLMSPPSCSHVSHSTGTFHKETDPCPVVAKIERLIGKFSGQRNEY